MTILIGLILLSFLVFFHELGHFIMAHICGVTVESFSVGMGPILLHHKWGKTDYRLSLIPLGGYCGMKGEKDFSKALEENKNSIEGDKDSFYGVHPFKRILIAFAGPFFNLLLALICFTCIGLIGFTTKTLSSTITMPKDTEEYKNLPSPAQDAGMQTGDKIIKINSTQVNDYEEIYSLIATHPDETINIQVDRQGQILNFEIKTLLNKETGQGQIGVIFNNNEIIEKEQKPMSFFKAGAYGLKQTGSMICLTVKSIGILFKGVKITSAVSGPVKITSMLGETVKFSFTENFKTGLISTLQFMAIINISLFLMNLLPVPVLDGGLILFSLIELVIRKKLHPKVLYYMQFVGLAFIMLLFAIALIGDISWLIKK